MTSNTIRFTGLFSGMDTESMVQQMMRAEGMRMDRLTRRRQHLVWRQEDVRASISHFNDFRNTRTNFLAPGAITNEATWNINRTNVTNANGGSTAGVNVTATGNAPQGSFDIRVLSVAQGDLVRGGVQFQGTATTATGPPVNVGTSMRAFLVNDSAGDPIAADTHTYVQINGVDIRAYADETIAHFMARVNANAVPVRMGFDEARGRFVMESTRSDATGVVFTGSDTEDWGILERMGLADIRDNAANIAPDARTVRVASDAVIEHDLNNPLGAIIITQNNNTFELNGLTINIDAAALTSAGGSQTFTISNTRDIDAAVDAIREFINAYNDLLRFINNLHSTPRPRHGTRTFYEPLTDEQRRAMSDREIERWEEQARIGMLHRNESLRNLHAHMRREIFAPVQLADGSRISLVNVGIMTQEGVGGERFIGLLELSEEGERRLREELETNPDRVQALFQRSHLDNDLSADRRTWHGENSAGLGLGFRLEAIMHSVAEDHDSPLRRLAGIEGQLDDGVQNQLGRRIHDYDSRIEQLQRWLVRREQHFFSMFARMENAMAQSHAQMDALFMFGSGM
jgi:flagellar hook-associated protein 2